MNKERFSASALSPEELTRLKELGRRCRGDIITMTTLAKSGHPGGSMSTVDILIVLYSYARVSSSQPFSPLRDRIIVSHGHVSPAVYSVLGRLGFFNVDEAISGFRRIDTPFEGHVIRELPGIEWSTGNLGQGLSAGCGMAIAARVKEEDWLTFVVMSDGEQAKGQIAEARRIARKFKLGNLIGLIDYNDIQISGYVHEVMPQNIKGNYESDGWKVIEVDGHDYLSIYQGLKEAANSEEPVAIIARTIIGKGVSFMEDKWEYHGKPLTEEEYIKAMQELGLENELKKYSELRKNYRCTVELRKEEVEYNLDPGTPFTYKKEDKTDNRSAFGKALADIGRINRDKKDSSPLIIFDCDLASSVKTSYCLDTCPENFFECGVQEHSTATLSGAASTQGVVAVFSDFGVFGVDETFNQHRLNDMNHTNLKLVCTHCGLDVGQDGKTHQCIDYIGAMKNLFGYKVIIPADPNQTDRVIRYILPRKGNYLVVMGRSKLSVILKEDGTPFFAGDYQFAYGKADQLREGTQGAILTYGTLVTSAVQIWETLHQKGIDIQLWNISSPLALDEEALEKAVSTGLVLTYEDHHIGTGLGSIVGEKIAEKGASVKFVKLGVSSYGESSTPSDLYRKFGLDVDSVVEKVTKALRK